MAFDFLENGLTNGASTWATQLSVASQLPGRIDGPADAYRHLLISAELHLQFSPVAANALLWGHELDLGFSSDSTVDFYNNDIGSAIGAYVKASGGNTEDVIFLVDQVMQNSFSTANASGTEWELVNGVWLTSDAAVTVLPDGTIIGPVGVAETDPDTWLPSNPRDDVTDQLIATEHVNWPSGGWGSNFNYTGTVGINEYNAYSIVSWAMAQSYVSGVPVDTAVLELLAQRPEFYEFSSVQQLIFVEISGSLGPDAFAGFLIDVTLTLVGAGRIDLVPPAQQCFSAGTNVQMARDGNLVSNSKPIEKIVVGDLVSSYDKNGDIVVGEVVRLHRSKVRVILDFWGTGVTPGHAYFCADGKAKGQHIILLDILRQDAAVQKMDGSLMRASTGADVESPLDGFVQAVTGKVGSDGQLKISASKSIRLGTRVILVDGRDICIADVIAAGGGTLREDGLIATEDCPEGMPFHWTFSDSLPNPEDYILKRSGTSLEDIYKAAEWEHHKPRMPAPMLYDGVPIGPAARKQREEMPRNEPLYMDDLLRKAQRSIN